MACVMCMGLRLPGGNGPGACRDGSKAPQIVEVAPPAPSGASGSFGKTQKF